VACEGLYKQDIRKISKLHKDRRQTVGRSNRSPYGPIITGTNSIHEKNQLAIKKMRLAHPANLLIGIEIDWVVERIIA